MGWEGRFERATEGEVGTEALVISVCRGEVHRSAAKAYMIQLKSKGDSSYVFCPWDPSHSHVHPRKSRSLSLP